MRGFSAIGLYRPKSPHNVGGVMRAAFCYGAAFVALHGERFHAAPTDVFKTWKHVPVFKVDDLMEVVPHDCVPVCVELVEGAKPLPLYTHPERAFYILGPEDSSVPKMLISQCRDVVSIPMRECMNLAACANVILYDRMAKQARVIR